jgi:hypothetical protein
MVAEAPLTPHTHTWGRDLRLGPSEHPVETANTRPNNSTPTQVKIVEAVYKCVQ